MDPGLSINATGFECDSACDATECEADPGFSASRDPAAAVDGTTLTMTETVIQAHKDSDWSPCDVGAEEVITTTLQ